MNDARTVIITVTIVGTLAPGEQLGAGLAELERVVTEIVTTRMPGFTPADPPVSIITIELLPAPAQQHSSPRVAAVEHDVIQAARQWHAKRRGAAAALRRAVEAYVRFPG